MTLASTGAKLLDTAFAPCSMSRALAACKERASFGLLLISSCRVLLRRSARSRRRRASPCGNRIFRQSNYTAQPSICEKNGAKRIRTHTLHCADVGDAIPRVAYLVCMYRMRNLALHLYCRDGFKPAQ